MKEIQDNKGSLQDSILEGGLTPPEYSKLCGMYQAYADIEDFTREQYTKLTKENIDND